MEGGRGAEHLASLLGVIGDFVATSGVRDDEAVVAPTTLRISSPPNNYENTYVM